MSGLIKALILYNQDSEKLSNLTELDLDRNS